MAFKSFDNNTAHLDDAKHWFNVNVLGISNPKEFKILEILTPMLKEELLTEIWKDKEIITQIRSLTANNEHPAKLILATKHPVSLKPKKALKDNLVRDGIPYNNNQIEVPLCPPPQKKTYTHIT